MHIKIHIRNIHHCNSKLGLWCFICGAYTANRFPSRDLYNEDNFRPSLTEKKLNIFFFNLQLLHCQRDENISTTRLVSASKRITKIMHSNYTWMMALPTESFGPFFKRRGPKLQDDEAYLLEKDGIHNKGRAVHPWRKDGITKYQSSHLSTGLLSKICMAEIVHTNCVYI